MTDNNTAVKNAGGNGEGDEAARLEAARNEAKAEGAKEGAQAAQARISGILTCEEAGKRTKLANHLAFNTTMSVEDARSTLAASAEDKPEAAAAVQPGVGPLATAMADDEGKTVGTDGGGDGKEVSATDRIIAAHAKATGAAKK